MDNPNPLMNSQDLLDFFDLYCSPNTTNYVHLCLDLLLLSNFLDQCNHPPIN